jgi:hypothetical protein
MIFVPGKSRSAVFAFLASLPSADTSSRIDAIAASIAVPGKSEQH